MPTTYNGSGVTRAARRCAELPRFKPYWPRARVRRFVASELGPSTTQLRYLLRRAARPSDAPIPVADSPLLAA
jgi:hypothetical protein